MARKGDGIYLRGNAWWLDFIHQGLRHQVSLGRNIKKSVAKELATVKRGQILRGEAGIGKRKKDILFDKAAQDFLAWVKTEKRPKTLRSYTQCVTQLRKSFAGKSLGEIHPFLIEKHKQRRLAEEAPVALNRELTCLKTLFNRMIDWRKFQGENPARKVKGVEESKGRTRYLDPDEEARLLAAAEEPLRTIVLLGIHTGVRILAEALTLRWENVDLVQGFLTVEAAYAKNKETETVPLNSQALAALKRLRQESRSEFVFTSRKGQPFKSIRTAFETACRRANLKDVSPHALRHTFASKLANSGVEDRSIQALGRWKEPKMIKRYAHLSQQHLREAVEKIAKDSTTVSTTPAVGNAAKLLTGP